MKLAQLLIEQNIRTALIVDDGCDDVPTAADMAMAGAEWATLIDDMDDSHWALLEQASPGLAEGRRDRLPSDDEFVAAVWKTRAQLGELADELFREYDANLEADRGHVAEVKRRLEAVGLSVEARGRSFDDAVSEVDLIVIDLYLGGGQDEQALTDSKRLLAESIKGRLGRPPLVILMSRSDLLDAKRDEFRAEVGIVDSGFRILRKSELATTDRLEKQLERLASNAVDTRNLARFFVELSTGVAEAADRTVRLMRNMRLSDVGQIKDLLLEVEGAPTGTYLVDVFDRVLQHEIESQGGIIDSARALNEFSAAAHPPPYVAGSPELQELVGRMLTQSARRLALPGAIEALVAFGDVLRRGEKLPAATDPDPLWASLTDSAVLLVITPACDLQRSDARAPNVLLLAGKASPLTSADWKYSPAARTPAIHIGGVLHSIKWDVKHLESVSWERLQNGIDTGCITVAARLREAYALELQQRVLSGLGRVGVPSPMPATFAVDVRAYVLNGEGSPTILNVPSAADGVLFIGRDGSANENPRLVLTEDGCDDLCAAIAAIDPTKVAAKSQNALRHIQRSGDLFRALLRGITVKKIFGDTWSNIPIESNANGGGQVMGLVTSNASMLDAPLDNGTQSKAGVILVVDLPRGETAAGPDLQHPVLARPGGAETSEEQNSADSR